MKNLVLSVGAGLIGGVLSSYFAPSLVHAQAPAGVPKEIRAQTFVLVNDKDEVLGTLSADGSPGMRRTVTMPDGSKRTLQIPQGDTKIRFTDPSGRVVWSAGGSGLIPLTATR